MSMKVSAMQSKLTCMLSYLLEFKLICSRIGTTVREMVPGCYTLGKIRKKSISILG